MRKSSFKPVSLALRAPTKKINAKRGFHNEMLINHWPELVGETLAQICQPSVVKPTRQGGAVLVLSCVASYASELTMRSEEIIMKLNAQLGGNVISKIQLKHEHVDFRQPTVEKIEPDRPIQPLPAGLKTTLGNVQNEELKQALEELSKDYYRHSKGV